MVCCFVAPVDSAWLVVLLFALLLLSPKWLQWPLRKSFCELFQQVIYELFQQVIYELFQQIVCLLQVRRTSDLGLRAPHPPSTPWSPPLTPTSTTPSVLTTPRDSKTSSTSLTSKHCRDRCAVVSIYCTTCCCFWWWRWCCWCSHKHFCPPCSWTGSSPSFCYLRNFFSTKVFMLSYSMLFNFRQCLLLAIFWSISNFYY